MSLAQGFPNTFSATQQTQEVLKNLNNETKKIYSDFNYIMSANGHAHTGIGDDGAIIAHATHATSADTATTATTATTANSATKLTTARNINGLPFDGTADIDIAINALQVGVPDNIVNGMTVSAGAGLQAVVASGRAIINETAVSFDVFTNTITLSPRMASLIYAKLDKTIGKVDATFPVVSTQTLRYILDGSLTIANTGTGGTNVVTKTGTVAPTDGRVGYSGKGDGSTGYYTCASNTGVPAYASASTRVLVIDNFVSNSAIQIFHNDGITKFGCTEANLLTINAVSTAYELEAGKSYVIALPADASSTSASVYVNGNMVSTGTYIVNTTAVAPTIYSGAAGASKSPSQLAYFEYYATKLTPTQIAAISNTLLFPCSYDGVDIRSILPANSISLGYAKTNSTSVIEIDSNSYKYGIRQGDVGGNRKVFLGRKYFSGATYFSWENPFGTRKFKTYFTWSQDANGINESDIDSGFLSGVEYGRRFYNTSSSRIRIQIGSGGACIFNGSWQASGYIGCYAEVIE